MGHRPMEPHPRAKIDADDAELPPEEVDRRRDDALRRALSMPSPRERARPSSDRVQKDTDRAKKQAKLPSR